MVICEADLRRMLLDDPSAAVVLGRGDMLTPAARDFIREHNIPIESRTESPKEMSVAKPLSPGEGYVDLSGRRYAEKPEHMTHLRGNVLVRKTHPRIRLRGKLDTFQAFVIEAQITARELGEPEVDRGLGEILTYVRDILASEVKDEPFSRAALLGLDEAALRSASHNPRRHFGVGHLTPDADMGKMNAKLNTLRALSREVELAGADAFVNADGDAGRPDLLLALNRLSSALYILICRRRKGDARE